MKKILLSLLIILAILISGCVSTINPVKPEDVHTSIQPITMKEFQDQDISVVISNNGTRPIDSVQVTSFDPFTGVSSNVVNIPARTTDGQSSASLDVRIKSPGFKTDTNDSNIVISYLSGKNDKGEPVVGTKTVPVQVTILPNAALQFVGFVKGLANITEAELISWEIGKGQNATVTFSVRNDGNTTIEKNTLTVLVDIENKDIGSNKTLVIGEAMARGGTSHTEGLLLPIYKDAPNGETDVFVTLLMGGNVIDSKTIHLRVKL